MPIAEGSALKATESGWLCGWKQFIKKRVSFFPVAAVSYDATAILPSENEVVTLVVVVVFEAVDAASFLHEEKRVNTTKHKRAG